MQRASARARAWREVLRAFLRGANDKDTHLNRARAVQDIGCLQRTVLSESVWAIARITVLLRTGRKLRPVRSLGRESGRSLRPQRIGLLCGKLKCEVLRKPFLVAAVLLIKLFCRNAVESVETLKR